MYIKEIQLENVKTFKNVEFSFTRPDGSLAGWTVFVGGNGSGKTTLLRAMALALMGPHAGNRILGNPAGWIRNGETTASVTAIVSRDPVWEEFKLAPRSPENVFEAGVQWHRDSRDDVPVFEAKGSEHPSIKKTPFAKYGPWSPNARGWFAASFGPMRRLSGGAPEAMVHYTRTKGEARHVTLFREDASLSWSGAWLSWLHAQSLEPARSDREEVGAFVENVVGLLGDGLLPEGMTFSRVTVDEVYLKDGRGVEIPMRDVSDGCRCIYATVLDIIRGLYDTYGADSLFPSDGGADRVVALPGVVIIDEVEAHLHPAWQRDIPDWLKKHFPAIQFLVSTHSPLVAQAADPNGLFILPLQSDYVSEPRAASEAEYEKVRLGSAFKTVLGVAFGLESTRTKWASDQIEKWQSLNAKAKAGAPMSEVEKLEFDKLKGQMDLIFN